MGPLSELEALIEEARWLGEGEPYEYDGQDPLQVLMGRVRGEEPERRVESTGSKKVERPGKERSESKGVEGSLGRVLSARLKQRELSGASRERAARLVAELIEERGGEKLNELWDLLVFGE